MDRRDFLRTVFSASLLTPLLLEASGRSSDTLLYLIADSPQDFLPSILADLGNHGLVSGRSLSFLGPHPEKNRLTPALSSRGWQITPHLSFADAALSFRLLGKEATPSFTLVHDGLIRDIRAGSLAHLWKEMSRLSTLSRSLTVVSFKPRGLLQTKGSAVAVYAHGRLQTKISLKKNTIKTFSTANGRVLVGVADGAARIIESSCRHKICMAAQPASISGERIICAPNRIHLEIEGLRQLDMVTG